MTYEFKCIRLSKEKRIVPYDYWGSFEKGKEGLSTKDKIYKSLTNITISDKNYKHVLNVWKTFRMKTMNCYDYNVYKLIIKIDVLLLV